MDSRPYTVHIYEKEAEYISWWTLAYGDIETGGDFFGLWLNENEVVVQAVLGPGKNCKRTTTSFFQDDKYLSKVGEILTLNHGLCNVGSWHSHHTMNLPRPSSGDEQTIWRHLPTPGRFLLLIATIVMREDGPKVDMNFFLFESTTKGNNVTSMKCSILKGRSPIRGNKAVCDELRQGAEVTSREEPSRRSDVNVEERAKHNGRRMIARRHHDLTCDGAPLYGYTHERHGYRNQQPRQQQPRYEFYFRYKRISRRREALVLCHEDHVFGRCGDCYNLAWVWGPDGKIQVVQRPGYNEENNDGCFSCIIL